MAICCVLAPEAHLSPRLISLRRPAVIRVFHRVKNTCISVLNGRVVGEMEGGRGGADLATGEFSVILDACNVPHDEPSGIRVRAGGKCRSQGYKERNRYKHPAVKNTAADD